MTHNRKGSRNIMGTYESYEEIESIIEDKFSSASTPSSRGFIHYVN